MVDKIKELTENDYKDPDEVLIEEVLDELGLQGKRSIKIEHDPKQTDLRTYYIKVRDKKVKIDCMPSAPDIEESKRRCIRQGLIQSLSLI